MKYVNEVMLFFADEVLKSAKRHLGRRRVGRNRSYGVATGLLKKSLTYRVRVRGEEIRQITFGVKGKADKYGAFLHWGVDGTRRDQKSPFFKFRKQPPSKVFKKWIKQKGIRLRDKQGRYIEHSESNINSAAFLMARSVKHKGIVGLRFYQKAFASVQARFAKKVPDAIVQDVQAKFKLQLGNIKVK